MKNIIFNIHGSRSKSTHLLSGVFTILSITFAFGQSEVDLRFFNPSYNCTSKSYCLDVQVQSDQTSDTLYGMNLRFFYNSAVMTFSSLQNLNADYDETVTASATLGSATSGEDFFSFPTGEIASWVNGSVQLDNSSGGLPISSGTWSTPFQVCFDIVGEPDKLDFFCPEIVWDKKSNSSQGFFEGNNGVLVTTKRPGQTTASPSEKVTHYNWSDFGPDAAPYGNYSASEGGCLLQSCETCNTPIQGPSIGND